jgi:outer membrane protein assembly factor BamA
MNNGYTDDGTAIDFSYSFPFMYFGSADVNKIVRQIEGLAFCSGSLTMTISYSWGTTNAQNATTEGIALSVTQSLYRTALYRSSYYRASGNVAYNTSNIIGRGKQFGITLSVSTSGVNIEIPYLIIRYAKEGRKLLS